MFSDTLTPFSCHTVPRCYRILASDFPVSDQILTMITMKSNKFEMIKYPLFWCVM